ncbi:HesA/MoeB/ThiF family protein [Vibrio sp.]|nr:HesA/MoeB/ThiF family protein [Vibrio sp.]
MEDKDFLRYQRHIMVEQIGEAGQQAFLNAKCVVIGMGGLGCPAAQYLVASGVGELVLIDHDVIELSNLQRQILYGVDDIGKAKVDVAKYHLLKNNPDCHIEAIQTSVFDCDLDMLLLDNVDMVLDCTDNPDTRRFINHHCVEAKVKLVSASAIQGAGQLVSFDFSQTDGPCYECIFPTTKGQVNNCATSGVLSPLLGVMGGLQATEVLRLLLGMNHHLGRLTLFDAWGMQTQQFTFKKSSHCTVCHEIE